MNLSTSVMAAASMSWRRPVSSGRCHHTCCSAHVRSAGRGSEARRAAGMRSQDVGNQCLSQIVRAIAVIAPSELAARPEFAIPQEALAAVGCPFGIIDLHIPERAGEPLLRPAVPWSKKGGQELAGWAADRR